MSNVCRNYLSVSGPKVDVEDFKIRCRGYNEYYPPDKEEAFMSKYEKELMRIMREIYETKYKGNIDGAEKSYQEAVDRIKTKYKYAEYTDEDWLQDTEAEKNRLLRNPPEFCLNALYPVPQEIINAWGYDGHLKNGYVSKEDDPVNYTRDGYHWCYEHWGTKHIIRKEISYEVFAGDVACNKSALGDQEEWEGFLFIRFETPWNPPGPWLLKISRDFKNLGFELCYQTSYPIGHGLLIIRDGEILHDSYIEYDKTKAGMNAIMGKLLK